MGNFYEAVEVNVFEIRIIVLTKDTPIFNGQNGESFSFKLVHFAKKMVAGWQGGLAPLPRLGHKEHSSRYHA